MCVCVYIWVWLMYALRAYINHPIFETFYEELKKLLKKKMAIFKCYIYKEK